MSPKSVSRFWDNDMHKINPRRDRMKSGFAELA